MPSACVNFGTNMTLRVVCGPGSYPGVLREAGADDADMLVAVTSSDECNMAALSNCLFAV